MVSAVLLLAAVGIAIGAAQAILSPQEAPESFTLLVLVGVLIAKETMFRVLSARGREIGSRALNADAWHHRSDALTSLAAFIGISVALTAGEGFESADDWAALVACAVITFNGVRLFRDSLREVLGRNGSEGNSRPRPADRPIRARRRWRGPAPGTSERFGAVGRHSCRSGG